MRPLLLFGLALLATAALPDTLATPLGLASHVATSETGDGQAYVPPELVVDIDGTLTLTNVDLRSHDVVSFADGAADQPWCGKFGWRGCPLFASPLVDLGDQGAVSGLDRLTRLRSYDFYCSIHPWMTGTLTAI